MLPSATRVALAADLAQAERSRRADPSADRRPPRDRRRRRLRDPADQHPPRLAEGARVVGHKVGLSSLAMQQMMGVDEPDYGHLLDDMVVLRGRPVKSDKYLLPAGRGRGRLRAGRDLPGEGCTEDDVLAATEAFVAGARADRQPDRRLEDRAGRHHRRQRLLGRLRARCSAGRARPTRHPQDRRGADQQRRGGRRGPHRRGARQSGHRGRLAGPQGRRASASGSRPATSCLPGSCTRAIDARPGDAVSSPISAGSGPSVVLRVKQIKERPWRPRRQPRSSAPATSAPT